MHRPSLPTALILCTIALLIGLGQTRATPPIAPPPTPKPQQLPIGEPPLVYAVLTKSGTGSNPAGSSCSWVFTDGVLSIPTNVLLPKLNIRAGAAFDDAAVVNGVANLGYDLISHTERAAASVPSISNGNSFSGDISIVEHWWFKRR